MINVMAKKRGRPRNARKGRSLGLAIDPLIMDALDEYCDRNILKPTKTTIVEIALREFLQKNDFWPWPRNE
jgi:hypothetical protein